ncbi:MAG: hypothetical protein JJU11_18405, partial [Candidatus Sumerlaeia bacterium]|nr:hypothetical protein [Candidatus Sumerlaeia bacterium]
DTVTLVRPVGVTFPFVVRPGARHYIEIEEIVQDWVKYEMVGRSLIHRSMIVESNASNRRYFLVGTRAPLIYESQQNIPDDFIYPPPIPRNLDPTVCNDTNNDGTIDAGDIVTSILGGGAP